MAIQDDDEEPFDTSEYEEAVQTAITQNPIVGVLCGGYYMGASIAEALSGAYLPRPLTGFEQKLRANPEIQKYLPIVMQNLADEWGIGNISPEKALIVATASIAFGCFITSEPIQREPPQQQSDPHNGVDS